jgi:hypothetical protein
MLVEVTYPNKADDGRLRHPRQALSSANAKGIRASLFFWSVADYIRELYPPPVRGAS